jgi:cell wall-associated NlpC family hydrolase
MTTFEVVVEVATGWTSPTAPRALDQAAVADVPDVAAWTESLDGPARLGLHGRTLTQLVRGEPAQLIEEAGDWVKVAAPWQPAPEDLRGYPSWVRRAHLTPAPDDQLPTLPTGSVPADPLKVMAEAGRHLGLSYLWGGTCRWGLDCSGLVHLAHREAGVVVPRDAAAQQQAATPVALGEERPGDLYFFARDNHVYHVGFVTDPGRMLHATEDGADGASGAGCVEDAPLTEQRRATLVAAGRFLQR